MHDLQPVWVFVYSCVSPPSRAGPKPRRMLGLDSENPALPLTPLRPASPVIDRAVGWIDTWLAIGLALPDVLVLVVLVLHGSSLLPFRGFAGLLST